MCTIPVNRLNGSFTTFAIRMTYKSVNINGLNEWHEVQYHCKICSFSMSLADDTRKLDLESFQHWKFSLDLGTKKYKYTFKHC